MTEQFIFPPQIGDAVIRMISNLNSVDPERISLLMIVAIDGTVSSVTNLDTDTQQSLMDHVTVANATGRTTVETQ